MQRASSILGNLSRPVLAAILGSLLVVGFAISYIVSTSINDRSASEDVCQQEMCVALYSDKITPDAITVPVGNYIRFNVADGKVHSLAPGGGAFDHEEKQGEHSANSSTDHEHTEAFSSGDIGADEAWRVRFDKTGTYILHDHYNPKLSVTVVVYEPGKNFQIR